MGTIFGKHRVKEPAYTLLFTKTTVAEGISYELRRYGQRFAAQTTYATGSSNDENASLQQLKSYVGVFGNPQNDGGKQNAIRAFEQQPQGKQIPRMTPVVVASAGVAPNTNTMMFFLPEEYKTLDSIPKPTNKAVTIKTILPRTGAVYRYSGTRRSERTTDLAAQLGNQLQADGFAKKGESLNDAEYWSYDAPFRLPVLRRHEIWIELDPTQVVFALSHFDS